MNKSLAAAKWLKLSEMAGAVLAMMIVFGGAGALVGGLLFGGEGVLVGACIGSGLVIAAAAAIF
jgi:hypothetical protein